MLNPFKTILNLRKVTNGTKSFYIYFEGEDSIIEHIQHKLVKGSVFLDNLYRGVVPFIGQAVTLRDADAMCYTTDVYKPRRDKWNAFRTTEVPSLIVNQQCQNFLNNLVENYDWFRSLDFEGIHKEINLFLFQIEVGHIVDANVSELNAFTHGFEDMMKSEPGRAQEKQANVEEQVDAGQTENIA